MRLFHLRQGRTFPVTVADLAQTIVEFIIMRRHTEHTAQQLHGVARTAERRRHERHLGGIEFVARKNVGQEFAGTDCLSLADLVQRNVLRTLKAASGIPFSLTVPDEVNGGRWHEITTLISSRHCEEHQRRRNPSSGAVDDFAHNDDILHFVPPNAIAGTKGCLS
jgi:hypothetical protein